DLLAGAPERHEVDDLALTGGQGTAFAAPRAAATPDEAATARRVERHEEHEALASDQLGVWRVMRGQGRSAGMDELGLAEEVGAALQEGTPLRLGLLGPVLDEAPRRDADHRVAPVSDRLQARAVDLDATAPLVQEDHEVVGALEGVPEERSPTGLAFESLAHGA